VLERVAVTGPLSGTLAAASALVTVLFLPRASVANPMAEQHVSPIHHAALFLGFANHEAEDHRATDVAVGAEYEWRLPAWHHTIGIGPIVEVTMANHAAVSSLAAAYLHPWRGLKLFAGGGVERNEGESHGLFRGGFAYDVHLGHHGCVTPLGSVERVENHTAVLAGMTIGYAF
jgi:hypothetical protein